MLQQIVMGPLSRTLGLIIIFAVFTLATGSVNGWYLLATPAGVVNNERFDRVALKGTNNSADAAWTAAKTKVSHGGTAATTDANSYYMVGKTLTGDTAEITAITTANQVFYTPLGTEVSVGSSTAGVFSGSEYQEAGTIFLGGLSGLIKLILQAAGLGLPIGALIGLASFGSAFVNRLGANPLMGAITMVIGLLLVGTLLNVLTPFVNNVSNSINGARYIMYDEGIGTLSVVISNFFAVVLVAGLIYVAWQVLGQFKTAGKGMTIFNSGGRADRM